MPYFYSICVILLWARIVRSLYICDDMYRNLARILEWVLGKRCVHISAQRVSYSGTDPGHQV